MAAYAIVDVHVSDPERFKEYTREVPRTLAPYRGRFLVRGGVHETVEGDHRPERIVVLEFPDLDAAKGWYASSAYQNILPVRVQSSRASFFTFVEGHTDPA